jgi:2-hydroxychromene-2-carboxylate isomerase
VERDDLTANREIMGDLREIQMEPGMNPELEFLLDYGSPFSCLGNLQIEGFARRNGAAVTYTPYSARRVTQGER